MERNRQHIALAFSQRKTEDQEAARVIEVWLRDAPVLCSAATRLFAAYMNGRTGTVPIDLVTVWARHLRRVLTVRFGVSVMISDVWERLMNDATRERADAVLAAFGPDDRFGPERFVFETNNPRFSRVWRIAAVAKHELLHDLAESRMMLPDDKCVHDLVYATFVVWMIASPRNPGIVMDDAHRLGAFVDEWLRQSQNDTKPVQLPVPPDRQLVQLGPRLVVDNDGDETEDL